MKRDISVHRVNHNGHLILKYENFKKTYIGYTAEQAKSEFWDLVRRETKKNLKLSLKNIY